MKKNHLIAVLALAATPAFLHAQTTSYSSIVGYSKVDVAAGGGVVAPVFVKAAVFSGSATVSGQTFSGSFSTSLNPTSFTDRPNYPTHYVEITSGPNEGAVFDVQSAGPSGISTSGIPAGLSGQTVSIAVRPHVTLGDVASASAGLADFSDAITVYRENNIKSSYIYTTSGVVGDDYSTPSDHVVIYPGYAVMFNTIGNSTFTLSGEVKTTKTQVPLFAGETLIAPLDPQGGKNVSQLNLAGALEGYTDAISLVSTTGDLSLNSFYSDGATDMLDENYTPVDATTDKVVNAGNGFIVNTLTDRVWTANAPVNP
jgi:hypothetical protein